MKTISSILFLLLSSVAGYGQTDQTIILSANHHISCFNEVIQLKMRPLTTVAGVKASQGIISSTPFTGTYTLSNKYILTAPNRYSINSLISLLPGVYSLNGERPSINGARPDATAYYIDGIRMLEYEPLYTLTPPISIK